MVRGMSAELETIEHQLEDSITSLRNNGVRITPQRQAILKFLIASHTHPTADEIYQALSPDFPNISVATIYNNLRVFKDIGIVKNFLMEILRVVLILVHTITITLYVNNVVKSLTSIIHN